MTFKRRLTKGSIERPLRLSTQHNSNGSDRLGGTWIGWENSFLIVTEDTLLRFGERAFHEDYHLAMAQGLIPRNEDNSEAALPANVTGKLSLLHEGIPLHIDQKDLDFIDQYLQTPSPPEGSENSQKHFVWRDYLAQKSEKFDSARRTFIEFYQAIKHGYDGPDDQEPVITNEYIRCFLMVCAICPPEWIALRPEELTHEHWNIDIYEPGYIENVLSPALRLHNTELDFINGERNRIIRELKPKELNSETEDDNTQSDPVTQDDAAGTIALDQPLALTFMQTWRAFQNQSRFKQLAKDRLRNLKSKAKAYNKALDTVITNNPRSQVVAPVFGIKSNQINDSLRRELLNGAWNEFTAFIPNCQRQMDGEKINSTLLNEHLIWWVTKQHVALLPTGEKRWQPHSYLATMLLFQANTFQRFPDAEHAQDSRPQKSWNPALSALENELKRLWDFSVRKAAKAVYEKLPNNAAPAGYVAINDQPNMLPPGVTSNNRALDIMPLEPEKKHAQIAHLHEFLEYHIFRDKALFLTLVPKLGLGNKPQTLRKKGKARHLAVPDKPWFIPPEKHHHG